MINSNKVNKMIDKLTTLLAQAIKRLSRMPGYTALSAIGLILSLSGTLIIARYLHQEWTVDSWMPDREQIAFAQIEEYESEEPDAQKGAMAAPKAMEGRQPINEMEGVEAATEVWLRSLLSVKLEDEETFTVCAITADSDFVKVFPLQAVEGTLDLRAGSSAIISEKLARKLFPGESAVGKTFTADNRLHTVTGIFREPSTKSSLHYEMVKTDEFSGGFLNNVLQLAFVRLKEGVTREQFNARQVRQRGRAQWNVEKDKEVFWQYHLAPYDFFLHMTNHNDWPSVNHPGSKGHLWMLLAVGVLLLFVGVFNFLNLYAVMRHTREHEMKVRRIFGASRWNIFSMLYMESLLISAPAMLGAWSVIELTTPHMKDWFNIEQMAMPAFDVGLTAAIVFLLPLLTSFIGRPSTTPSLAGKARGGSGKAGGGSFLFLQYFISLTLVTVSLYYMLQLHRMMTAELGFETENIISCLPYTSDMYMHENPDKEVSDRQLFRERMRESPFVRDLCEDQNFMAEKYEVNDVNGTQMYWMEMNEHVQNVMGLEILEGRSLCDSLDNSYHCLINETALKHLGLKNWRTEGITLTNHIHYSRDTDLSKGPTYQVVGILKDFHPMRQSEPQPALFITYEEDKYGRQQTVYYIGSSEKRTLVSIEPGHEAEAVTYLKKVEKEVFGKDDLDYHWLSDEVKAMYEEDRRTARIFTTFALLAIGVTCLGVLGLMMFDVRRRYREIALRKVHGARFRDIALLLSRRYLIILGLAAAVSIPVSLIGLHKLITRYYTIHATIAWWIPLVSLLIVFLLSALTLWHQIWRATRIEPSTVMKVE